MSDEDLLGKMVDRLVRQGVVRSARVEAAFRSVPRHLFLPGVPLEEVYSGEAIVTKGGLDGRPISSSSMPQIMAVMLEQLRLEPGERVLEIGTGTGYNAGLLAALVGPTGRVTSVDVDGDLVAGAEANLARAGVDRVSLHTSDGWLGVAEDAPFHAIAVTVGVWDLSPSWVEQLAEGGRMAVPLWVRAGIQLSMALRKGAGGLVSESVAPCGFMRLRGPHAGPEGYARSGRWTICLDEATPRMTELVSSLLAMEPRVEPARVVMGGAWFSGFALRESEMVPIQLEDWAAKRWAHGVIDPVGDSMALIEGSSLFAYGSDGARDYLVSRLSEIEFVELSQLTFRLVASERVLPAEERVVVRRPNFTLVLA